MFRVLDPDWGSSSSLRSSYTYDIISVLVHFPLRCDQQGHVTSSVVQISQKPEMVDRESNRIFENGIKFRESFRGLEPRDDLDLDVSVSHYADHPFRYDFLWGKNKPTFCYFIIIIKGLWKLM